MTEKFSQKSNRLSQGNGFLLLTEENSGVSCDTVSVCLDFA